LLSVAPHNCSRQFQPNTEAMKRYRPDPTRPEEPAPTDRRGSAAARRGQIDYSIIPELGDEFFTKARRMLPEIDWSKCPDAESIPGKMSGAWCLKGTSIRCIDITGQFEAGRTPEEIAGLDIYPELDVDVVRRVLAFTQKPIRWVVRRKAALVAAIKAGEITLEEACRRYQLTEEEIRAWQRAYEDVHGLPGLRATRLQRYRPREPRQPRRRS
jgi:uncharacterized protein (DUF433 family)